MDGHLALIGGRPKERGKMVVVLWHLISQRLEQLGK